MSKKTTVRTYFSLFLATDGSYEDAVTCLAPYQLKFTKYVDNEDSGRRVQMSRMKKSNEEFFKSARPLRHNWLVCSDGHVASALFEPHFNWVFEQLPSNMKLGDLVNNGFRVDLVCFWETADFGGGPVITQKIAQRLQHHMVNLEFDIYPKESESP